MQDFLRRSVEGWTVMDHPRFYRGKEIFEYMDGAGEVFLAYRYQQLLVQRFVRENQADILVEIFDMGDSRNAFGISTYMRGQGKPVQFGQDGEYQRGLLSFWRDRYYVCVRIEKETPEAKNAVLAFGRTIAQAVNKDGERPQLLVCLPREAYESGSLRYFYTDEILRAHVTLPEGNPFRLTDSTEGVLGRLTKDRTYFLCIHYPDSGKADEAARSFLGGSAQDNALNDSVRKVSGVWVGCRRKGDFIRAVLGAPTRKRVEEILASLERRLP